MPKIPQFITDANPGLFDSVLRLLTTLEQGVQLREVEQLSLQIYNIQDYDPRHLTQSSFLEKIRWPYFKTSLCHLFPALSFEFEYNYNNEKDLLSHKTL